MSKKTDTVKRTDEAKPLSLEDLIMSLPPSQAPESILALTLADKKISSMPSQLAFLKQLRRLDLSNNALTSVDPLVKLQSLSQLKLAGNKLTSIAALRGLTKLTVLDISNNNVSSLEGVDGLGSLAAFIAPSNSIGDVSLLGSCAKLETVVLSRNSLQADSLVSLNTLSKTLRKISASHCGIAALPVLDLPLLNELRLNGNAITDFPDGTAFRSLKLLDVANNKISSLSSLKPFSVFIQQLHLHGNPIIEDDSVSVVSVPMRRIIGHMFKNLKNLDGKAFTVPTPQEVREDRLRRVHGEAAPETSDSKTGDTVPTATMKETTAPMKRAAKLTEPEDVVYTGAIPEAPVQKNYVRSAKVHRTEAKPAANGVADKSTADPRKPREVTPAVPSNTLKGAAALAALLDDSAPTAGW